MYFSSAVHNYSTNVLSSQQILFLMVGLDLISNYEDDIDNLVRTKLQRELTHASDMVFSRIPTTRTPTLTFISSLIWAYAHKLVIAETHVVLV